jgi:hypothetical protein
MSSIDTKPEDGTDMPHVDTLTKADEPVGAARFLTKKARSNKADGSK